MLVRGLLAMALSLLVSTSWAVQINEIRIDQPSSDNDEYVELAGEAGELLNDVSYLVIGDGTGASGVIESVTDLSSYSIGSDGLLLLHESTWTSAVTGEITTLNFENSDNVTHLLVKGFAAASGDDLDLDDDGVLDSTPWSEIVDSVALVESVDSGEKVYSNTLIGPDGTFVPGHVFRCSDGWNIGGFSYPADDTPAAANNCGGTNPTITLTIPEIQSEGTESPYMNQMVITQGVVTADYQGEDELKGFFMQDVSGDANPLTSDGLFVYGPESMDVNVGDLVEVTGEVTEFFGLTEISVSNGSIKIIGQGTIEPTLVTLPEATQDELERYEGMLIEIDGSMTVAQNYFVGRYGQMTLSSADDKGVAGRLFQPTQLFPADSAEAIALADNNARRLLVLDDGQDVSGFGDNPNPVPYLGNPPQVIRAGDSVSNLMGVLDYGRINSASTPARDYRLHPTVDPIFSNDNQREDIPTVMEGDITVASFNVLNYFTTIDANGAQCGPMLDQGCRGADSPTEFERQQTKIVNALAAIDADIVGLIEIENNGFGTDSAIQNLVDALNTKLGISDYAVAKTVDETPLGTDVITVGFIYKTNKVTPVGLAATLDTGAFSSLITDGGLSRQPLAVSFETIASNEVFTVAVNHFKSKRPPSEPQNNGNDDQGNGAGSWNLRRTEAAQQLADWLATNPTGIVDPDVMIIGDLNAYGQEDPMLVLESSGYTDLARYIEGDSTYSYIFDGQSGTLDYALANPSLLANVNGVTEWHINADEPAVIDYDERFNPEGYYEPTVYRASDHDPVIVSLSFAAPILDEDMDGVIDAEDQCLATPAGKSVNRKGCSGEQFVELKCDMHYPAKPWRYYRCVVNKSWKAYRKGLLARHERREVIQAAWRRIW